MQHPLFALISSLCLSSSLLALDTEEPAPKKSRAEASAPALPGPPAGLTLLNALPFDLLAHSASFLPDTDILRLGSAGRWQGFGAPELVFYARSQAGGTVKRNFGASTTGLRKLDASVQADPGTGWPGPEPEGPSESAGREFRAREHPHARFRGGIEAPGHRHPYEH